MLHEQFFLIIVISTIIVGDARPQHVRNRRESFHETLEQVAENTFTHFGRFKIDYKKLNLPNANSDLNEAPHAFKLSNDGSGNYYFQFDTSELERYEVGELKNAGTDHEIQVVRGRYIETIQNDNGPPIIREIGYVADENGYRPFVISIASVLSVAAAPPEKSGISGTVLATLTGGSLG